MKTKQSAEVSLKKLFVVLGITLLLSLQFYLTDYSYYGIIQPPTSQGILGVGYTFSYFSSLIYVAIFVLAWLKENKQNTEEVNVHY